MALCYVGLFDLEAFYIRAVVSVHPMNFSFLAHFIILSADNFEGNISLAQTSRHDRGFNTNLTDFHRKMKIKKTFDLFEEKNLMREKGVCHIQRIDVGEIAMPIITVVS